MNYIYENVEIAFPFQGEEVTGILDGTFKWWTFSSQSPAFLKLFPKGQMVGGSLWFDDDKHIGEELFNGIYKAAEAKGYSFTKDDE